MPSSIYEEVNLPSLDVQKHVVSKDNHDHPHHDADEDHYLDKILQIAHGELGNEYEILEDKHNPHKARKGYKKPLENNQPSSKAGYLPSPKQPESSFDDVENQYRNPLAHHNRNRATKVNLFQEDPYYEAPEPKSPYVPEPALPKIKKPSLSKSDDKYRNPAGLAHHNRHEATKVNLFQEDPYHEAPVPKSSYVPEPALPKIQNPSLSKADAKYRNPAAQYENFPEIHPNIIKPEINDPYYEDPHTKPAHVPKPLQVENSYIPDSEQKYRDPSNQYGGYELEKIQKAKHVPETPYYDADVTDSEHDLASEHSIHDYDYNSLKSEDRYFNVPVAGDDYGGPEISLIGVSDLDTHHEKAHDHKEVHGDKYDDHEVYSVTNLKKTNLGSGRQHNGGGFATKDGFYYTRTEDYHPSEANEPIAETHPVPSKRIGQYTEVIVCIF